MSPLESECIAPQWPLVVRKEADEGQVPDYRYPLWSASVGTNPGEGFDFCFNKTIAKKFQKDLSCLDSQLLNSCKERIQKII
ncbi:hypothetical protein TNCV_1501311 [Trichonephila clavipes]|uniref:Uncharacterized protein n=1 Tax=Trichonephila clavipes TaxID=2585209 RepID=A0A8X6V8P3_TRICX|nr:hypothetical protein TNCV_1501311 [Trichonephila clavipes]